MRAILIILLLGLSNAYAQRDSVRFHAFGGFSFVSYFTTGTIYKSGTPLGLKGGLGLTKQIDEKYLFGSNLWYQTASYSDLRTNFYDSYWKELVSLTTTVNFQKIYWSVEAGRKWKDFTFGLNVGISYLLQSKTTQDVHGGTGLTAINIYNQYTVYQFQKDSYYNNTNPFAGFTLTYFPMRDFGFRLENNTDILSNPASGYQYFKRFFGSITSLSLTLKL